MERLLASDPHAAARANALRKTFDLLNHLPVPQPSSTFTTRTLTQLQTRLIPAKPQMPWLHWLWPMAASLAAFAVGATVQRFTAPGETAPVTHIADSLDDLPVVESLPIYQGIDDVASLQSLVQSGAFSNENRDVLPSPPIKRSADELQQWIDTFRALTPARQQQLRSIHQNLQALPVGERAEVRSTLEAYAVWLTRLPDVQRTELLAISGDKRTEAIQELRARQWQDLLPDQKRQGLKLLSVTEKLEFLQATAQNESAYRREWQLAQQQWKEMKELGDAPPWPFHDPQLAREIDLYLKNALGVDVTKLATSLDRRSEIPADCRLKPGELRELRRRREEAIHGQYWLSYGELLLRLSRDHPTLPRPRSGETTTRPAQIKAITVRDVLLTKNSIGKWPEFALEVHKKHPRLAEALGPARPEEMTDAVRDAITNDLLPKLAPDERKKLDSLLGKWPGYPEEALRLAASKNLPLPEVCLPGTPELWKKHYVFQTTPR